MRGNLNEQGYNSLSDDTLESTGGAAAGAAAGINGSEDHVDGEIITAGAQQVPSQDAWESAPNEALKAECARWGSKRYLDQVMMLLDLSITTGGVSCFVRFPEYIPIALLGIISIETIKSFKEVTEILKSNVSRTEKLKSFAKLVGPNFLVILACAVAYNKPEIIALLQRDLSSLKHPTLEAQLGVVVPFEVALGIRGIGIILPDMKEKAARWWKYRQELSTYMRTQSHLPVDAEEGNDAVMNSPVAREMSQLYSEKQSILFWMMMKGMPIAVALPNLFMFVLTLIPPMGNETVMQVQDAVRPYSGDAAVLGLGLQALVVGKDLVKAGVTGYSSGSQEVRQNLGLEALSQVPVVSPSNCLRGAVNCVTAPFASVAAWWNGPATQQDPAAYRAV